jgi:carbon storage regulator
MLVLSRRVGETLIIDGDIEVVVIAVQGDRVRIGIKAPPSVRVDRQEIHDRRVAVPESVRCVQPV